MMGEFGMNGQRPTTGIPTYTGYGQLDTAGTHSTYPNMPHAMQNHQATSKKSFRIRSKQEHDLMKMNFSNAAKSTKDL